jgi:diguanylate cyclase (GGDEF)-like protein
MKNMMAAALDLINEGVVFVDGQERVAYVNRAATDLLGEKLDLKVGRKAEDLFGQGQWMLMRQQKRLELPQKLHFQTESTFDGWVIVVRDAAHLYDALTGVYTRATFEQEIRRVEKERDRARISPRDDAGVGIFFIDVDNLKAVNTKGGHAAGDRLLQTVAKDIQDLVRSRDLVVRYGGDEFVVVASRVDEATTMRIAERIRRRASEHQASVSIGTIHLHAKSDITIVTAIEAADQRMYQEKKSKEER